MTLELPFLTPELPAIAGRFKERPEDFEVEELPAYGPSGEGEHVLFGIEKRGLTTPAALEAVARALGVPRSNLGHAGQKDAQAVARQQFSASGTTPEAVRALAIPGLRVLGAERHQSKLRVGHLRGNRFRIRLRGVDAGRADDVGAVLAVLARRGLPNGFGPQRFGRDGNSWRQRGRRSLGLLRFYVSAWQSWLFNQVLAARWESFDTLIEGDLAWLHDRGAVFRVTDPAAEAPRAAELLLSPSGPLFGPRMLEPMGAALAVERAVLATHGLSGPDLGGPRFLQWQGARRPLRVPVGELGHAFDRDGDGDFLELRFTLPPGAYATCLVRELTKETQSVLDTE